jgi:hypothetical protein
MQIEWRVVGDEDVGRKFRRSYLGRGLESGKDVSQRWKDMLDGEDEGGVVLQ